MNDSENTSAVEKVDRRFLPKRDGDKRQARSAVARAVATGRLTAASELPCVDCAHPKSEPGNQHEYDHHLGYDVMHYLDVQPVCNRCHVRRAIERGEINTAGLARWRAERAARIRREREDGIMPRERHFKSITTKLTPTLYAAIVKWNGGPLEPNSSEWFRDRIEEMLSRPKGESETETRVVLEQMIRLSMVVFEVLQTIAAGEKITPERVALLAREMDKQAPARAAALVNGRR